MAVDYTETIADEGDAEGKALDAFANGMPYAFVVATSIEPLHLRVGSQVDVATIRALLVATLKALPEE